MKALGIVAIIAGLIIILVYISGLTSGTNAPQLIVGLVIAIAGLALVRRAARKP